MWLIVSRKGISTCLSQRSRVWKSSYRVENTSVSAGRLNFEWYKATEKHVDLIARIIKKHINIVSYCGVCSWPWQWFALGIADCLLFVTSNRCILFENRMGWSIVLFCACEVMKLFLSVFCVVRDIHNFGFRLVINKRRTNADRRVLNKLLHAVVKTLVFDRICMFSLDHCCEC